MHRGPGNGSSLLVVLDSSPTCATNEICFSQAHLMLPKQIGALNLDIPNKTGVGGKGKEKESMVDEPTYLRCLHREKPTPQLSIPVFQSLPHRLPVPSLPSSLTLSSGLTVSVMVPTLVLPSPIFRPLCWLCVHLWLLFIFTSSVSTQRLWRAVQLPSMALLLLWASNPRLSWSISSFSASLLCGWPY